MNELKVKCYTYGEKKPGHGMFCMIHLRGCAHLLSLFYDALNNDWGDGGISYGAHESDIWFEIPNPTMEGGQGE